MSLAKDFRLSRKRQNNLDSSLDLSSPFGKAFLKHRNHTLTDSSDQP